jgi:hypothetical protein
VLEASKVWDRRTSSVQVTDATDKGIVVRVLASARDAGSLFDLRCEVREKLVAFLQGGYSVSLPRLRTEVRLPEASESRA